MNLFYVDLYNHRAVSGVDGGALTFPEVVAGQTLRYGLRFLRWSGSFFEEDQPISSLRVSLGYRDARPTSGTYKIKIGSGPSTESNTTTTIDWNSTPLILQTALNSVADGEGDYSVDVDNGSYLIRRTGGEEIVFSVVSNKLKPISTGRIGGTEIDGEWVYDLRLTQMPLAFTDSTERKLPDAPTISTVQDGGTDPSGTFEWPEIQKLYLPTLFRGTYQLRRGYAKTKVLDTSDGPDELQEALNEILAPEFGRVTVTNPTNNEAHITFGGDLMGQNLDELIVQVYSAPPGDWSFDLNCDTASLRAALREKETITVPFEADADIYLNPADPSEGTRTVKLWSTELTIRRPLIWPDLASVQDVDWLRPPSPTDYIPFTTNQVITGQQHFTASLGSDFASGNPSIFVVDHDLDTDEIAGVTIRENASGGAILLSGYSVEVTSENSITITFDTAPDLDEYAIVITAAGPVSAFQNHTHTIAQIVSLQDLLDDFGSRIEALEAMLPRPGAATAGGTPEPAEYDLPDFGEVLVDVGVLESAATLASQIVVGVSSKQALPEGTEAAAAEKRLAEEAEAATKDPDALGVDVVYRAQIAAVGRVGQIGSEAKKDAEGNVVVPATPAVDADPVLWPARSESLAAKGRWPLLLPAIDEDTVTEKTTLPSMPAWPGAVYKWTDTDPLLLPGGGGRRSQWVPVNGHFGSDGRSWYRVALDAVTGLYHPVEMERELWRVYLGDEQFPSASELSVSGELRLRLLSDPFDAEARAVGRVQLGAGYGLVCEAVPLAGTGDSGDSSTTVVIGRSRVTLSPAQETMRWDLRALRAADGNVSATWSGYRKAQSPATMPDPPFVLRMRLTAFDTDNDSEDPRGQVSLVAPGSILEVRQRTA
jgi:hypothetical protein